MGQKEPRSDALGNLGLESLLPSEEVFLKKRLNIAEEGWAPPDFYSHFLFYDQIRMGDYEGIGKRNGEPHTEYRLEEVPLFSDNPRKNIEYGQIAGIALSMQAAIEGGLNPTTAFSIASLYYRKVGHGQTMEEYQKLNGEMVQTFAKAVHRERLSFHENPIVQECDRYLMNHLTTPFHLEELVEHSGYSAPYLQRIYKKETGQTLTGMLRLARIRLAMYWLQRTDLPIDDIAQQLCFSSHSHFGAVFKDVTGLSPRDYREQVQHRKKPDAAVEG